MSEEMQIHIKDGEIRYIHNDDLAANMLKIGQSETKRVSHVEPCDGGWEADMGPVNGPVLGPFTTRKEALAEEVKWLKAHGIPAAQ
jgi:hypothetical protein